MCNALPWGWDSCALHAMYAGLMTDRPAVEAWLLCSEAVRIPPQCLSVTVLTSLPTLNASYHPEFSTASAADFRYVINYAQHINGSAAAAQDFPGIITLDLEGNRSPLSCPSCLQSHTSRQAHPAAEAAIRHHGRAA